MTIVNDYELIYLVQCEFDQIALATIINKYQRLIYKMIHQLYINYNDFDDFYQEALMTLYKAINTFDERYEKTFTRYFELILKRHLLRVKHKLKPFVFLEDVNIIQSEERYDLTERLESISFIHPIEKIVHEHYFIGKQTQESICKEFNLTKKQVYNAVFRLKAKYKDML